MISIIQLLHCVTSSDKIHAKHQNCNEKRHLHGTSRGLPKSLTSRIYIVVLPVHLRRLVTGVHHDAACSKNGNDLQSRPKSPHEASKCHEEIRKRKDIFLNVSQHDILRNVHEILTIFRGISRTPHVLLNTDMTFQYHIFLTKSV